MINVQLDFLFFLNFVDLQIKIISGAYNSLLITLPHFQLPLNLFTSVAVEQFELVNIIIDYFNNIPITISLGYIILSCDIFIATAIISLSGRGKIATEVLDSTAKLVGIALGSTLIYKNLFEKNKGGSSSDSSDSSDNDKDKNKDKDKKDSKKTGTSDNGGNGSNEGGSKNNESNTNK
jgi:hypothetical protein